MSAPKFDFTCPHCNRPLTRTTAPDPSFFDGMGFGSEELMICFNDECPLYVKAWKVMSERYKKHGSQRFYMDPTDGDQGALPIAHKGAMKGDIVEE